MNGDDDEMQQCDFCDLRFQVIFCVDVWTQAGKRVVNVCPRCGEKLDDESEEW